MFQTGLTRVTKFRGLIAGRFQTDLTNLITARTVVGLAVVVHLRLAVSSLCAQPCWSISVVSSLCAQPCWSISVVSSLCAQPCWSISVVSSLCAQPCWSISGGESLPKTLVTTDVSDHRH